MKGSKVAARYATSLLELAIEKGNLESVAGDMKYLHDTNEQNADLTSLFNSPIVSGDKKIAIYKEIFGQFEDISMSFLELITNNSRENLMPEIAASFETQLKEHKGIVPVHLITAVELDEETKKNILAKIEGSVNGTLEVTESIDASLIGGFIVKMGDKQIDASISSQFNKLKQSLTH
ncbi:MAG: F-type H+-transporting ATPase subunit delta [Lentimonas sp.]|jgi:F-type H+-transporting ATPase subunit delta